MTKKQWDETSLEELCEKLSNKEIGNITERDTLKMFAIECIENDDVNVASHICEALYNYADYYTYDYSMGTLETPEPIDSKEDIEEYRKDI